MVLSLDSKVLAAKDQLSCNLSGEVVILSMGSGLYFGLDLVGARVWELVQEPRSVGQIAERLVEEYDVDPDRCRGDLLELLGEMERRGLIDVTGDRDGQT